jgi:hypothetical protein
VNRRFRGSTGAVAPNPHGDQTKYDQDDHSDEHLSAAIGSGCH